MISKKTKKKFLESLEENPLVTRACAKVGIHRSVVYRWREEDDDFAEEMDRYIEMGRGKLCDITEGKLFEICLSGNLKALIYFLEHNHPLYIDPERKDIGNRKIKPITTNKIQFANFEGEDKKPENQAKEKILLLPAPKKS